MSDYRRHTAPALVVGTAAHIVRYSRVVADKPKARTLAARTVAVRPAHMHRIVGHIAVGNSSSEPHNRPAVGTVHELTTMVAAWGTADVQHSGGQRWTRMRRCAYRTGRRLVCPSLSLLSSLDSGERRATRRCRGGLPALTLNRP